MNCSCSSFRLLQHVTIDKGAKTGAEVQNSNVRYKQGSMRALLKLFITAVYFYDQGEMELEPLNTKQAKAVRN